MNAIRQIATPGLGKITRVLLAAMCLLLFGCGQAVAQQRRDAEQQRRVLVKCSFEKDADRVGCWNYQRLKFFVGAYAEAAKDAGKNSYGFLAFDGDLFMVDLSRKADKSMDMMFPYIFRGDEKMPLDFTCRNGLALLNGEVVCVDLKNPAAVKWLSSKQPHAKLKTVRTLLLSDDAVVDVPALQRLAGQGIMVSLKSPPRVSKAAKAIPLKSVFKADTELAKALIAAKPAGLMIDAKIPEKVIMQLPGLTHLVITGPKIPNLSKLENLRFLGFFFTGDKPSSLAPLAKLTQLQGLILGDCKQVSDFSPLQKLERLRSLTIVTEYGLKNLEFLAGMSDLRSLCLRFTCDKDKNKLKSIAPLAKLSNLSELYISPITPAVKDLSPLKKLKNLRVLIVDESSLKERKAEYDEIRKALPECRIVGFCMGSVWILAVIPAAMVAGLLWRRRRRAAGKVA